MRYRLSGKSRTAIPELSSRTNLSKIAVAGPLCVAPAVALDAVVPAPPPADPPPTPPPPPPGQPTYGEYYNPGDQDDWWAYSGTGSF